MSIVTRKSPERMPSVIEDTQWRSLYEAMHLRLRRFGIVILGCDCTGAIVARSAVGEDWLCDLFCESPFFRQRLCECASLWSAQSEPGPVGVGGKGIAPYASGTQSDEAATADESGDDQPEGGRVIFGRRATDAPGVVVLVDGPEHRPAADRRTDVREAGRDRRSGEHGKSSTHGQTSRDAGVTAGGLVLAPMPVVLGPRAVTAAAATQPAGRKRTSCGMSSGSTPRGALRAAGRRNGYLVAVIVTDEFLNCEFLHAMCQASRLDVELTRSWLRQLPPVHRSNVQRISMLAQQLFHDQRQLLSQRNDLESMGSQLADAYEEINLLYTVIQSMSVVDQPERFISICCEGLLETLPYAWFGVMLKENWIKSADIADDDSSHRKTAGEIGTTLGDLGGRLIMAGDPGHSIEQMQTTIQQLMDEIEPESALVLQPTHKPDHQKYAVLGNTAMVHPIRLDKNRKNGSSSGQTGEHAGSDEDFEGGEGAVIGVFIAGEKHGVDTEVSSVDIKLVGATALHMGIFFENAVLYDDLNAMFLGTLEALTASIDAKDRYTCGHSQRVAHLCAQLAARMGLDWATVQRIHIAGLVHDIGKIGVPEQVLCKPGRLTEDEFEWIRKHPEIGHRILKDIPQLSDVLPGVLHHHERWDGKGYPHGLKGESIPVFARIIALADSFDAMSSHRTYRKAMSRSEVLEEISRCAGTQYDPGLVPHFVDLDFTKFDDYIKEHQAVDDARQDAA